MKSDWRLPVLVRPAPLVSVNFASVEGEELPTTHERSGGMFIGPPSTMIVPDENVRNWLVRLSEPVCSVPPAIESDEPGVQILVAPLTLTTPSAAIVIAPVAPC